jgi:hypothetical protein
MSTDDAGEHCGRGGGGCGEEQKQEEDGEVAVERAAVASEEKLLHLCQHQQQRGIRVLGCFLLVSMSPCLCKWVLWVCNG